MKCCDNMPQRHLLCFLLTADILSYGIVCIIGLLFKYDWSLTICERKENLSRYIPKPRTKIMGQARFPSSNIPKTKNLLDLQCSRTPRFIGI
ncbi:unnamed protein product [Cylicocyclus nassatus]|uniref:Uncharacterized protein n=1 Tax=Cylicocyclus nassatus TaxID=53992 RepID=A0AA36DLR7_CYLNA|nr:unnamed protein product [Cylicocyclus nassatus]